jgi:hypothetical protein
MKTKTSQRRDLERYVKKYGIGWLLFELLKYIDREDGRLDQFRKDLVAARESYALRDLQ